MDGVSANTISVASPLSSSLNAGIALQVANAGANFLKDSLLSYFRERMNHLKISDIEYNSGFHFSLKNMRIEKIRLRETRVDFIPPSKLKLRTTLCSADLNGCFLLSTDFLWCAFDLDGAFEMEFTNLDCTLTFHLGKNKSGKPVVATLIETCSTTEGTLNLYVDDTGCDLAFNILLSFASKYFRDWILDQVCQALTKFANEQSKKFTQSFNPYPTLPLPGLGADVRLVQAPSVTQRMVRFEIVGRIFSTNQEKEKYPAIAPTIPLNSNQDRMFEACFSEYVFNSSLFALWENKAFSGVIPEAKFQLPVQLTTDDLSRLIPGLRKYSTRPLKFKYSMPEMPLGKFSSNNITLTFILQVEIDFDLLDGSQLNALVINAAVDASGCVSVDNHLIIGSLTKLSLDLGLVKTNVGIVPLTFVNLLLQLLIPTTILPAINKIAEQGIEIKPFLGFMVKDEKVVLEDGTVKIAADMEYENDQEL